ncbi:uncharacterized protein IUM83_01021 [Phytophthora cinnamomi]|uniref:uncharacterized protein n=1 Tax=Phytophthora cinnamomi TaxID=4785 RepID=UPI00355AC0BD|nr:hypothetical protein IUM83_01021 [Phytophthora cinnamomi]
MRSDFLRMLFQWLRYDEYFAPDSSVTKPPNCGENGGSTTRIDTFELHDFRFTRHGGYPKRHALLIITQQNLQLAFLVERKLELECSDDAIGWAKHFSDDVNEHCVKEIATFCNQDLEAYIKTTRILRQERVEGVQTQFADQLQRSHESIHNPFLWYSVALDRLRGVIIGDELPFTHSQQIQSQPDNSDYILTRFVQNVVAQQLSTRCTCDPAIETSPELPSGIPPLKLNVDDPNTLFLREKPTDEGDISTSDAHIFPQSQHTHEPYENKGRELRQTAERVFVNGQPFWVVASYFETLEFFSILDAALPPDLLEHEMNRLCAFGGADPATTSESDE